MFAHRARGSRQRRLLLESLEERAVPAAFGIPWSDPGHITISFAPDGTRIAGHASMLFQTLGPRTAAAWEGQILRAFQTWAAGAGISVSAVPDDGEAFGTPGQVQHDPRFGDIRVGAQPMASDALAISVPNDPSMTGTWTGDLLFNSADLFDAKHLDLFAVALHEAGHTFGLDESPDPKSPMFGSYADNTALTPGDVKAIQALYGTRRADLREGSSGNETISTASQLPIPGGYNGATPLVAFGDIGTSKDVDIYAIRPPLSNYQGPATIRLQSAGISLLAPHLTVLDARGNVLGDAQATGAFGDVVTVRLARVSPGQTYYLKVQGATSDVFGIGHYGLAVTFDGLSTTAGSRVDQVLRGDYQTLDPNEIDSLFRDPAHALFHDDHHSDDATASATVLAPTPGFPRDSHYGIVASIADPADVDNYRVKTVSAPSGQLNVVTVKVRAIAPNGAAPKVAVFDSDGNPVSTTILANGDGLYTIQAVGFKSGGNLILRVAAAGNPARVGNYGLDADFGGAAANPTTFATGTVSAAAPTRSAPLYIARSQLFQFLLAANAPGTPAGVGVRMSIVDASGRTVFDLTAMAGDVVSGPSVLLTPGAYTVRYSAVAPKGVAIPAVSFQLSGRVISDPIGPTISDPTLNPVYTTPKKPGVYTYPTGDVSTIAYWLGATA